MGTSIEFQYAQLREATQLGHRSTAGGVSLLQNLHRAAVRAFASRARPSMGIACRTYLTKRLKSRLDRHSREPTGARTQIVEEIIIGPQESDQA
jgi:hypothetical protein